MSETDNLPESIRELTAGKAFTVNDVGMSDAKVIVFDDCVLKVAPFDKQNEDTVRVMRWLDGKIPVPKVICYEADPEYQYLLMSRIPGKMSCDSYYMQRPDIRSQKLFDALGIKPDMEKIRYFILLDELF